jgi:hypothetical protein
MGKRLAATNGGITNDLANSGSSIRRQKQKLRIAGARGTDRGSGEASSACQENSNMSRLYPRMPRTGTRTVIAAKAADVPNVDIQLDAAVHRSRARG